MEIIINKDIKNVIINGTNYPLSENMLKTLVYMARKNNRVITRSDLIEKIWDGGTSNRSVDVIMSKLRQIEPLKEVLTTIRNRGYVYSSDNTTIVSQNQIIVDNIEFDKIVKNDDGQSYAVYCLNDEWRVLLLSEYNKRYGNDYS